MSFPGHVLIIPIAHTPLTSPSEQFEMESYREKLTAFFDARNCHTVTFEIHSSEGIHAHWQVIPVPKSKSVDDEFVRGFEEKKLTLEQREPGESEEYCRVILPTGNYVATLPVRFDLHLPRRILAKLLQLEERQDWRNCIQTKDEEQADASAFRAEFELGEQAAVTQPDSSGG
jgi:Protein similar to CwfJ C-terminus 1/Protein similar to CwfJ C-terminus 2